MASIHSSQAPRVLCSAAKANTKSVAEDWPRAKGEQKVVGKVFKKYCRGLAGDSGLNPRSFCKLYQRGAICNKTAECISVGIIGSLNFGGDSSLALVHVIVGTTLRITYPPNQSSRQPEKLTPSTRTMLDSPSKHNGELTFKVSSSECKDEVPGNRDDVHFHVCAPFCHVYFHLPCLFEYRGRSDYQGRRRREKGEEIGRKVEARDSQGHICLEFVGSAAIFSVNYLGV
jgi:hypothetical protein